MGYDYYLLNHTRKQYIQLGKQSEIAENYIILEYLCRIGGAQQLEQVGEDSPQLAHNCYPGDGKVPYREIVLSNYNDSDEDQMHLLSEDIHRPTLTRIGEQLSFGEYVTKEIDAVKQRIVDQIVKAVGGKVVALHLAHNNPNLQNVVVDSNKVGTIETICVFSPTFTFKVEFKPTYE